MSSFLRFTRRPHCRFRIFVCLFPARPWPDLRSIGQDCSRRYHIVESYAYEMIKLWPLRSLAVVAIARCLQGMRVRVVSFAVSFVPFSPVRRNVVLLSSAPQTVSPSRTNSVASVDYSSTGSLSPLTIASKLLKNTPASFLEVFVISAPPSCASFPPISALTS